MLLQNYSKYQIKCLKDIVSQLTDEEYSNLKDGSFSSSIGKHIRHIISFYLMFFDGVKSGNLSYDKRIRAKNIETKTVEAEKKLNEIINELNIKIQDKELNLKLKINNEDLHMVSSMSREMVYLMEHTTHHMAIIRIILDEKAPHIEVDKNFGIAYSTPK